MTIQLDDTFEEVLGNTFEGMAFSFVERSDDLDFDWSRADLCWASIDLIEPAQGRLYLVVPTEEAIALAESVVGDQGLQPDDALAVLGEVANTVGGLWLIELDEGNRGTRLGLPKTGIGTLPEDAGAQVALFDFDEGLIGALLVVGPTHDDL